MVAESSYLYRIKLDGITDVIEFVRTASKVSYEISIVNGKHKLNAKSFLGVMLAKGSWDEMFIESTTDCFFDFEKYIV